MNYLTQSEIRALCNQNPDIRDCWDALKNHPQFPIIKNRVIEIYSHAHFMTPVTESSFVYRTARGSLGRMIVKLTEAGASFRNVEYIA